MSYVVYDTVWLMLSKGDLEAFNQDGLVSRVGRICLQGRLPGPAGTAGRRPEGGHGGTGLVIAAVAFSCL